MKIWLRDCNSDPFYATFTDSIPILYFTVRRRMVG